MNTNKLIDWLKNQKKINKIQIKKKKINSLKDWIFKENIIFHKTNNFFSIKPFLFQKKNKKEFQPLILQKEHGILGIIKQKKKGKDYYLLQSKIEPGNINGIQISPTVQATKSNYLRKHGGKKTLFLDYFLKQQKKLKIISKIKLSEQGSRFLKKKNWNILLETDKITIPLKKNYCWLTKENIRYLLNKKNMLNMDTISVLSSAIKKNLNENILNSNNKLKNKLDQFDKKIKSKRKAISFNNLNGWKIKKNSISDIKNKYFSIFFIEIFANLREVKKWEQPIISDHFSSLNGFLVSKINNTMHYLLKIIDEPGFDQSKYTSTIFKKNFSFNSKKNIKFLSFFNKSSCLMDLINSDEGGRFLNNQSRNMINEIKDYKKINLNKNFIWASHNQVVNLIKQNKITIEARNLFACYNIDKIY
jgi:dTDP-4-dehydro-6-deoxy-alpha-D-glucopyranose 2,3-dehydratase